MDGILRLKRTIATVEPETVFQINDFPIANSTLMLSVVILLVIIIAVLFHRWQALRPGRFQNLVELFYEKVLAVVGQITGSQARAEKIFPLIGAIFVFVIFSNLLGVVPGLSNVTWQGTNIFRTATSDFNTTFSLALAMILFIQLVSIREIGFWQYLGKFFQFHLVYRGFKEGLSAGLVAVINFFIGLLDIVSEAAKVVSLSLRLFGNMFAGDVLAVLVLAGFTIGLPALWMSANLLAAVVQTMVFSFLVTAYYTMALKPEEGVKGH